MEGDPGRGPNRGSGLFATGTEALRPKERAEV